MSNPRAHVIFCDDIRQEITGKFFLIGVYSGEIIVHVSPASFSVGTWISIEGLEQGSHDLKCKVFFQDSDGERLVGEMSAALDVKGDDFAVVIAPTGLPLQVDRSGSLVAKLEFDGFHELTAGSIKVTVQDQTIPAS